MRGDEAEPVEERVRRALGRLGEGADSAPEVPTAVTARIGAALRSAPAPPAHSTAPGRPWSIALVVGVGAVVAVVAAAAVGIAILLHTSPAPRFPSGPTAERMTISHAPADTPNPVVTRP